jgi:Fibronectin type III domain
MAWLGALVFFAGVGFLIGWGIGGGGGGPHASISIPRPSIESVLGKSVNIITLTWTYPEVEPTTGSPIPLPSRFEIERTAPHQGTVFFPVPASGFLMSVDDTNLVPWTLYSYRVRAVYTNGIGPWSGPRGGRTLPFIPSFGATLTMDEGGWEGKTLVQRIEAVRLNRSGTQVRLTLRASSTQDANIESIFISQPDPAGDNRYDSAADLKLFFGKVDVRANTSVTLSDTLPDVNYNLDESQPLLIAVDFSRGFPSGVRFRGTVPANEATAYFHAGAEASFRNRTAGYSQASRIYLIERIEVG